MTSNLTPDQIQSLVRANEKVEGVLAPLLAEIEKLETYVEEER